MKQLVCLFLCLLLLFSFGCQKESELEKGFLYTEDGITQNALARIEITTIDRENYDIGIIIFNDTDYELQYSDDHHDFSLYVWFDDAWFLLSNRFIDRGIIRNELPAVAAHSSKEVTLHYFSELSSDDPNYTFHYDIPTEGVYRLVLFTAGLKGVDKDDPFSSFNLCTYFSTDNTAPARPNQ